MKYSLYNGEVELDFDENKHLYWVSDKLVPGVTGVLDIIAKPALIGWAVKCCGLYLEKHLHPGQTYDEIQIKNMIGDMKKSYRKVSGDAADIGSLVHAWCEGHIKAKLGLSQPPSMPFNQESRNAIEAFLQWERQHEVEYIASECKIYSRQYSYAGTMDLDAIIDGRRTVADFKTSTGIYREMALQVALYRQAREEEGYGPYQDSWIIRVGKDGVFEAQSFPNYTHDLAGGLAALRLHQWSKNGIVK